VAVKDNICTAAGSTTCGSRMLADFRSPYAAGVVDRLERAGAVVIAKTNLDEFAMGSSTEHSAVGPTRNPWDLDRVVGGSSGGSAAAVAAGIVPVALGTETGGSVRQPAAMCGVIGVKPSYGRVSRFGLVAFASSLDQIGLFASTTQDAAVLLQVLAGNDPRDSTSLDHPVPDYANAVRQSAGHVRLGVARECLGPGLDEEVRADVERAIDVYRDLGAKIVDVSLPRQHTAVACYYVIASAEAASNLARYDGIHFGRRTTGPADAFDLCTRSRAEGFGPEVKRRIMLGNFALSHGYYDAYYLKAAKVRTLIRRDFEQAFQGVDAIVTPTTPTPAFRLGEKLDDPLSMYLADVYTVPASLAGLPAVSLPCGFASGGLPVGMQLIGPFLGEARLLQLSAMYEAVTDWHERRPPLLMERQP
jgi:aspartyl-tRNA(Asn)/glutamyl-tRNA(Gln) amidotransferase subunit A